MITSSTDSSSAPADSGRALLVIDGDCAAGKTTLAGQIAARLSCNIFHMDDFFLPPDKRTDKRLSEAGGNVDYERFLSEVLTPLVTGKPFTYGAYSCSADTVINVKTTPQPVTVIEGSYSLHPAFREPYQTLHAMKVFMQLSSAEQLRRIRERNGEAMLRRFQTEWIPMEKQYHAAFRDTWEDVTFIDG